MYICGQKDILNKLQVLNNSGMFPTFSIITGHAGYGKKVISEYIANMLRADYFPCDISVDGVRQAVYSAYCELSEKPRVFAFYDCDNMSIAAKNAMLKVVEEPPKNTYFIVTVRDISTVLPTILSRGRLFNLQSYSDEDRSEYLDRYVSKKKLELSERATRVIQYVCACPNDIAIACNCDIEAVYDLSDKFIQLIGATNLANELKIVNRLRIKKNDGDDKIDPTLFLRCVLMCVNGYMRADATPEDLRVFYTISKLTSSVLVELDKSGANKQIVLDNYITDLHIGIAGDVS